MRYPEDDTQPPIRKGEPGQCPATARIGFDTAQCLLNISRHTKHRAQLEYRVNGIAQERRGYFHWETDKPARP